MADADDRARHPKTGTSHKRVGSTVRGKYRVEAFLATGTMGNVYAATHRNGSKVALKILHRQLAEDPALCERFKREGYFANSIGHPGIVRAIDDDVTEDGCPFLVMELLEGETIEERRRRKGGTLPLKWLLPVTDSLLEILAAAHKHNVVHRDLKPDNVFVTKSGEVKVLDFGVARWNDGKSSSDMTGVGMVLGTPAYMPPEQALGRREDVDAQSDLWAVGATLFVALSGESVHVGGDAKAKLIATARTAARPIREAAPDVPRAVAQVIDRALAFHKQERWPDAEAMREALRWARISLEDRPSQQVAASSEPEVEKIPAPVPTRRTVEDEPTVMRLHRAAFDPDPNDPQAPQSKDFLTSAPPITMRDTPRSTGPVPSSMGPVFSLKNEPVFSLRREKDGRDESPSTERIPKSEHTSDTAIVVAHASDRVVHADAMPSYDPASMMGDEMPASSARAGTEGKSIDVNFSFTRPMAAMVMPPGYETGPPPRAVTGPPPHLRTAPGIGPVHPTTQPPPQPPAGYGAPHLSSGPPAPHLSSGPPAPHLSSGPPASPGPNFSSGPPPHLSSNPADAYALTQLPTGPSMRIVAEASSRPSLTPEAPGPLLSQIVKPRWGIASVARIVVPIALALGAIVAVVVMLRTRAANAQRAATATAASENPAVNASAAPGASGATAAPAGAPAAASSVAAGTSAPAGAGAAPAVGGAGIASSSVSNLPDADPKSAKAEPKKKKPRRKPPAAKPAEPAAAADTASAATTAATSDRPEPTVTPPATAAPPPTTAPTTTTTPDLTPKDSLPTKDPDPPKPAPAPAPAAPADPASP